MYIFTDEETEGQNIDVTYPRSYSWAGIQIWSILDFEVHAIILHAVLFQGSCENWLKEEKKLLVLDFIWRKGVEWVLTGRSE